MKVKACARLDRTARITSSIGFAVDGVVAIQDLRKYSSCSGLTRAAWAAEQIGMPNPLLAHGVAERLDQMLLANHVAKGLRTVAAVEGLIGHGKTLPLNLRVIRADRNRVYTGLGSRPKIAEGKRSRSGALNRTVIALAFTSFFTDISSEMVAAVVPLFLTAELGFSPLLFGAFQAAYEIANALLRVLGGIIADRTKKPKQTAATGYGISTASRMGLLAATLASLPVVPFLLIDRLGKGLRTGPRDAMITLATPERSWGTAFGFHRTLDAAGAMIGPLIAFAILLALPGSFTSIFTFSVGFGLLGLAVIVTWAKNPRYDGPTTERAIGSLDTTTQTAATQTTKTLIRELFKNTGYRRIVGIGMAFSAFMIGDAFIYLVIFEAARNSSSIGVGGFGAEWFPLLFVGTAIGFLVTATPLGRLADKIGRARVWALGQVALLAVLGSLLFQPTSVLAIIGVLALLGLFYGATDGVLPALAAGVIPEEHRSAGLAVLSTLIAIARTGSAFAFGLMWHRLSVDSALIAMTIGLLLTIGTVGLFALTQEAPAETE